MLIMTKQDIKVIKRKFVYSKVMKVGESGRRKICLRDKEAELVLEMYQVLIVPIFVFHSGNKNYQAQIKSHYFTDRFIPLLQHVFEEKRGALDFRL